ncbi:MAG TPA: 16S rRNA (adenine(1518)-N(6)/adenine(1519)-N(6))-dimethyltransferase RsmA [Solirubrobacteraceae bacterium]|jgi:16S rRNA (adenine1518-N6/adenine1519-N6)-dimethyltransferase|nr:16S rRNA (adenine(1518)-N(6)/adenine(1519)-N(6))-dimethyltransferase RsmA [Solirubrobacteraceae bacterium]
MSTVAGPRPSAHEPNEQAGGLVQPSLRRLRQFGVRPDHDLGQNFLIDSNILAVIGRAAEISSRDAVLEVGGGLGVLSEYLAQHAQHVHVVEIDERLRDALCNATDPYANVTVHWADAMVLDLRSLQPAPTKVVANLPYGVAASVLLRSVEELASVSLWVAMVQREVGERLAAAPVGAAAGASKGAYGAPSVLAQLACDVDVVRAIPRTVFHPVPNVDSVLVRLRRRADCRVVSPALRALVAGGFAHRRKTLAGSLGLAGAGVGARPARVGARGATGSAGGVPRSREQIREALVSLGHPADARAERLSPEDFLALAGLLEL